MTVYVDNMKMPWRGMIMSHMMADELEELHEMAEKIGMKRQWFQAYPQHSIPHYDVSEGKRQLAIRLGAVEEDMFSDAMVAFRREWRRRARTSVKIWNIKDKNIPLDAILVDRSTPFGNPYSHLPNAAARYSAPSREEAIASYRRWIWRRDNLRLRMTMREILRGKDLVCHCVPQECHAYVVAEIANDPRFDHVFNP